MEIKEILASLWGANFLRINLKNELVCSLDEATIFLSTNEENFLRYEKMQSFMKLFSNLGLEVNKYNIQTIQAGILNAVLKLKIRRDELIFNLFRLQNENLLSKKYFEALEKFLNSLDLNEIHIENSQQESFHKNLDNLNSLCDDLVEFCDDKLVKRLKQAKNSANSANFNIALCGIINSGKSSLLNAMIQSDLLGVSNVPQTASICVLKYAHMPYAKIEFWNQEELANMGLEAKNLEDKFIKLDELKAYSSANNGLVKYIKECSLGIESDILKDINIIDTPGIDDAVKQREELSTRYLKNCDAMLYLMNSAQAASAKDINFIRHILTNTKNSEIIVVLTHIDRLAQGDKISVLDYTQKSLQKEFGENLDIKYFLVSSTQNIGINELKAYLLQSFFNGSSKKTALILDSYKKELSFILAILYERYDEILRTLGLKSTELAKEYQMLEEQDEQLNQQLKTASSHINQILLALEEEQNEINNEIFIIASKSTDRLINDLNYAKSNKQKPNFQRLVQILTSALKDFSIDLLRERRQVLEQMLSHFALNLEQILSGFSFSVPDFKSYLDEVEFELDYNNLEFMLNSVLSSNDDNLEVLSTELKKAIANFLLGQKLDEHINNLLLASMQNFKSNLDDKFSQLQSALIASRQSMQDALNNASKDETNTAKAKEENLQKFNKIISLKQRLEQC